MASLRNLLAMQRDGILGRPDPVAGLSVGAAAPRAVTQPQTTPIMPRQQASPPPPGAGPGIIPPQEEGQGGENFLGRALTALVGGQADPRFSAEENAQLRQYAIMSAGLAMIADPDGGAEAIARGLISGRQSVDQRRAQLDADNQVRAQRAREEQERALIEQRRQIMANVNPWEEGGTRNAAWEMMNAGDMEGASQMFGFAQADADMTAPQRAEAARRRLFEDSDLSTIEGVTDAAARAAQWGMTAELDALEKRAQTLMNYQQHLGRGRIRNDGEYEWFELESGGEAPGTRVRMNMTEYQRAQIREQQADRDARVAAGATDAQLAAADNIWNDWKPRADKLEQTAVYARAALGGMQVNPLSGESTYVPPPPNNAQGDYQRVFALQKLIEEASAVLGGEVETVTGLSKTGWDRFARDRMARSGEFKDDAARQEIIAQIERLTVIAAQRNARIVADLSMRAAQRGIPPIPQFRNFFEGVGQDPYTQGLP